MMNTEKAEELLRSFYTVRIAEAKAGGPHGRIGGPATPANVQSRGSIDRYAWLDTTRSTLTAAAAALIIMAGIGFAFQNRDARPVSAVSLSLLATISVGAEDLDQAMDAIRGSVPRLELKGERL